MVLCVRDNMDNCRLISFGANHAAAPINTFILFKKSTDCVLMIIL